MIFALVTFFTNKDDICHEDRMNKSAVPVVPRQALLYLG